MPSQDTQEIQTQYLHKTSQNSMRKNHQSKPIQEITKQPPTRQQRTHHHHDRHCMQDNSQPHTNSVSQVAASKLEPQTHKQNQQNSHLKQQVQISQKRRINIEQSQSLPTPRVLHTQTSIHPRTHTRDPMDIYQSKHLRDFCTPQTIFEPFHPARPCSPTQGGTLNKPTAKSFGHGFATSHRFIRHYRVS